MSACESSSFIWDTHQVLGKGATGIVYHGVNKKNGEPVAVKTFKTNTRSSAAIMKEFELLRILDHENIVKLLAIEEEKRSRSQVIVLELCSGDCLMTIMNAPENRYGLCDEEFLLVVKDTSAGIKYLREINIIHRDVKPANIMKFIKDDGTSVYKLVDFGTARELKDDQSFESIHGTEEYLHPDIYGRALMGETEDKHFGVNVDLWSIGATFYHVATGNVPFRPHGGRNNRNVMFHMITNKRPGIISATQRRPNGSIEWSDDLPNDCLLSTGLRMLVRPILVGLLENDPSRVWSFERFFSTIQDLVGRVPIHIFYANHATSIKTFLKRDDTLENLQSEIQRQTKLNVQNQYIQHNDQLLESIDEFLRGEKCTPTSQDSPLMLFCTDDIVETNLYINNCNVEIPQMNVQSLNLAERTLDQAQASCVTVFTIKRHIDSISLSCYLVDLFVHQWVKALKTYLRILKFRADALSILKVYLLDTAHLLDIKNKGNSKWTNKLKNLAEEKNENIKKLYSTHVIENTLTVKWKTANHEIKYPHANRLPGQAKILAERLKNDYSKLRNDYYTHSNYSGKSNSLEIKKIKRADENTKKLLNVECIPTANQVAEIFKNWYNDAKKVYLLYVELDKHLEKSDEELRRIGSEMQKSVNLIKSETNNQNSQEGIEGQELKKIQNELLNFLKKFDLKKLTDIDFVL